MEPVDHQHRHHGRSKRHAFAQWNAWTAIEVGEHACHGTQPTRKRTGDGRHLTDVHGRGGIADADH